MLAITLQEKCIDIGSYLPLFYKIVLTTWKTFLNSLTHSVSNLTLTIKAAFKLI